MCAPSRVVAFGNVANPRSVLLSFSDQGRHERRTLRVYLDSHQKAGEANTPTAPFVWGCHGEEAWVIPWSSKRTPISRCIRDGSQLHDPQGCSQPPRSRVAGLCLIVSLSQFLRPAQAAVHPSVDVLLAAQDDPTQLCVYTGKNGFPKSETCSSGYFT